VRDAEDNAVKDKERKEGVEARNELDTQMHSVTKNLKEHAEKLDDETKKAVEEAVEEAKKVTCYQFFCFLTLYVLSLPLHAITPLFYTLWTFTGDNIKIAVLHVIYLKTYCYLSAFPCI
jgi:hypothetical protein